MKQKRAYFSGTRHATKVTSPGLRNSTFDVMVYIWASSFVTQDKPDKD
jgi:hypothetical protein